MTEADDIVVDTLDVWQEWLPEFDAETINAKYKGVSGEPMTPAEVTAWKKIRELASRFQRLIASSWESRCGISPSLTS
jgi:FMN-dependent NADH-azoreductase